MRPFLILWGFGCPIFYKQLYKFSMTDIIIDRPSWDEYFLMIAFTVSLRSDDPNIKHGAVLVDHKKHIIGTGYNGTIKGADLSKIPMHDRDAKRPYMQHAELNCCLNTTKSSSDIDDKCIIYVTGEPCNNCLQLLINFGIRNIVIADRMGSISENEQSRKMKQSLLDMTGVNIKTIKTTKWIEQYYLKCN